MAHRPPPSGLAQSRVVRVLSIGAQVDLDQLVATRAERLVRLRNTTLGEILLAVFCIAALASSGDSTVVQSLAALTLIPLLILATSQLAFWLVRR